MNTFIRKHTALFIGLLCGISALMVAYTLSLDLAGFDYIWSKTATTFIIFVFSILAFKGAPDVLKWGIPAGLLLCTIGDFVIAWNFTAGLIVFLHAHIALMVAFFLFSKRISLWGMVLTFGISGFVFFGFLFSSCGPMLVPVAVYTGIISLMVASALSVLKTGLLPGCRILIAVGAVLFYASDIIIAFHRFVYHLPHSIQVIYPVYYAGLICLTAALFTAGKTQEHDSGGLKTS